MVRAGTGWSGRHEAAAAPQDGGRSDVDHPLTAPAVDPPTMYRCRNW